MVCALFTSALSGQVQSLKKKQNQKSCSDKARFGLAWDVSELETLNEKGRQLCVEVDTLRDSLSDASFDMCHNNVPKKLCAIIEQSESMVKGVSRHMRTPATHALTIMISPEEVPWVTRSGCTRPSQQGDKGNGTERDESSR